MKQLLTLLVLFGLVLQAEAQLCLPDPIYSDSAVGVYPPPRNAANPDGGIDKVACINEPYEFVFTFRVPPTFDLNGVNVRLDSVVVDASDRNSVKGLPEGLDWACNPPNCSFDPVEDSIGCLVILGTPTAANTPKDYPLSITATIYNSFTPLTLDLPSPLLSGASGDYTIELKNEGDCTTSTQETFERNFDLKAKPNPFSYFTQFEIQSEANDQVQLIVTDMLGKLIHQEQLQLIVGRNIVEYDGSQLVNGIYLYSISNKEGKITRKMVLNR